MSWIWLLAFALIAIGILAAITNNGGSSGSVGFPYQMGKPLFSAAEQSFLRVLDQAIGPDYRVFGKVRVADIAMVKPGLGKSARQGALNRVAGKHFDFVVCRADSLLVVCAIELNDKSHASRAAQARDEWVAKVCRTIGLPLLTIAAKAAYSPLDLRTQFLATVGAVVANAQTRTDAGAAAHSQ